MIKTRFAPSPTGSLHIGGARTALFAWLFARHHQGQFILRIEDTDTERSTPQATHTILEGLHWLGLNYDEGPYFQSKRLDRYHTILQHLLDTQYAYRCTCTPERLAQLRQAQQANKQKPRYDGLCRERHLGPTISEPHVIRFRTPKTGQVLVQDQIHGTICFENTELDDLILARSDGSPTYNFTVVVDDFEMEITHVIRGDDHINNTPRQLNLWYALKETLNIQVVLPTYAHLPMIRGVDGKKLSKRTGALSVMHYRDLGYLPEAVINYLARLGWSHGDQEIFAQQELIQYFDGSCLNKASATLNPKKLLWLNQHHLKQADPSRLANLLKPCLAKKESHSFETPSLIEVVKAQQTRVETLEEMAEKSRFFYKAPQIDAIPVEKPLSSAMAALHTSLNALNEWTAPVIHRILKETAEHFQLKLGELAKILRQILTGSVVSPPLDVVMHLLGKTQTLLRISKRNLLTKKPQKKCKTFSEGLLKDEKN